MSIHLATPHCAKVGITYHHSTENVHAENTFYVEDPTDTIFGDFPGFATQIFTAVTAQLVPHMYPQVIFDGVVLEDVRTVPYGGSDYPFTQVAGSKAGGTTVLPTQNALCFSKVTAKFGRSYRGRWYHPLWNAAELFTADTVLTARANEVGAALAAFQTAVQTGTYPVTMGIVSQQINKVVRSNGLFQAITAWRYVDGNVDSQRRRLVGRGV